MLADYHMHSMYSDDTTVPMEAMIKQAISLGLDEICFTEHVDYGLKDDTNCPYYFYFREGRFLQEKYQDKIKIKLGIEFGVQMETIPLFKKAVQDYDFDFIIMSNHQIGNLEFWNYHFQDGKTQEEYVTAYYQAILDCVKNYKDYNVLGHLDMIKRHDERPLYPDEKIHDVIVEILKIVIADGKGIEINTSSFFYGLDELMPSRYILKLYKELGGKIITLGSDAHKPERVGEHFDLALKTLVELGFSEVYTFSKKQAIAHPINI